MDGVRRVGLLAMCLALVVTGAACGARAEAAALGPGEVTVELDLRYSRFRPAELTIHDGTLVRFVVRNRDPIRHELIVGPPEVHARHRNGTEAVHPPVPGEVTVEPGTTAETTFHVHGAGDMEFACHLPGHYQYGMRGTIHLVD
jgi:uncharacterized cupredoxin-like copper-binding protein